MGRDYRSVVFKHQALLDIEAVSLLQLCIARRHIDAIDDDFNNVFEHVAHALITIVMRLR
jgi:hypothetical protein